MQIPGTPLTPISRNDLGLALHISNMWAVFTYITAVVLWTSADSKLLWRYLAAVTLGDIGHLTALAVGMGRDNMLDVGSWSGNMWGNVIISVC